MTHSPQIDPGGSREPLEPGLARRYRAIGTTTAAWGIVFAAIHSYWAAGGSIGYDPSGQSTFDSLYIGFVALLGLAGAAVALGLSRPWGARVGHARLLLLARLGGTLLSLGVVVGIGGWIAQGSIADDGTSGIVITAYFLVGGVLYSALGWLRDVAPADDSRRLWMRSASTR